MKADLIHLGVRIRQELPDLENSIERASLGVIRAQKFHDDIYLDAAALNLHAFYSGLERLFEKIARILDQQLPHGANWHQVLLLQMS